ncbi:MAG: 3-phosphoshikimate 1-carboxyvinyltransferase, partial [Myxococcota bacterium]|nr:3-phosphoshikimate 1-carboxyvinyltransferase [Myxococcota bacterium]
MSAPTPLKGSVRVPGDKSIGHRSLLMGALCDGEVSVTGLGSGEDNLATQRALEQMGVRIERAGTEATIHGVGLQGLTAPTRPIDCGNSGTTMRLLLGILAGQPFPVTLVGDRSLSRRPMGRVLEPLSQMGLDVVRAEDGSRAPLTVQGRRDLRPLSYDSPIASAQVKSAILLAGLWANGETSVREPHPSRDHTERMLDFLGRPPGPGALHVPGDLSSAAFILGAALLIPQSQVTVRGVGVNPTRTGFLEVIKTMGAHVSLSNEEQRNGEPSADLTLSQGPLRGAEISGALTVRAIDELPLVATVATQAEGPTV